MSQPIYKNPNEQANAMSQVLKYRVPKEALIYEGESEPDLPWLINRYGIDLKYLGDTDGGYDVSGSQEDLERFYNAHKLDSFGVERVKVGR